MYSSYESIINFVQEKDSSEFKPYLCQDINSNPVEKFSRLWLRKLVFRCSHLQVLIRDFPLPLLKSDFLEVSGFISMAQLHCPEKFLVIVPWSLHDDIIENVCSGSVVPQKIYHSLKIVASGVFFSYGYSLDSHIEMFSRALGRLSMLVAPGTQKFQPVDDLKWWDKFRYKYHGDIEFDIRDLCFKFLVTSIPYEVECIDLQSSHLVLSSRTGIIEANFSAFQLSFQRSERIARSPLPALDSYWKVIQKYRSDYYNLGITNPLFPVMCLIDLKVCFEFDWICGKKDILYASHYVHHVPEIKDDDCTFLQNFDLYHYFRAVDMNSKMIIRFRPCSDFGNNKSQFRIWMDDVHWFKVIQQAITTPPFTSRVIPVFRDRDGAFSLPVGKRSSITTSSIIHSVNFFFCFYHVFVLTLDL